MATTTKSKATKPADDEDDDKATKSRGASITVDPETVPIGSPVRITATGTEGEIYVTGLGVDQTLVPDENGIVMATFQHTGEATVSAKKAKGKGSAEATLTVV